MIDTPPSALNVEPAPVVKSKPINKLLALPAMPVNRPLVCTLPNTATPAEPLTKILPAAEDAKPPLTKIWPPYNEMGPATLMVCPTINPDVLPSLPKRTLLIVGAKL